uniref:THAP-type domain-containing protein n=1 Tax=Neogobius melanostomus TaxID=47308 RepID=A0A8C6SQF9_9GOBI
YLTLFSFMNFPNKNSRLCGSHFAEECFVITGGKKHLRLTAVPTIFDFSLKGKRMTAQEKPGNDANIQPTTSKEHNYTVSRSPKSIKRQMETQLISVEEKLDHCRKKLKTEQLKTRRLKKQVNSLSEVISEKTLEVLLSVYPITVPSIPVHSLFESMVWLSDRKDRTEKTCARS